MFHGDADEKIPIACAREMKTLIEVARKKGELVEYKGAYNHFDREPNNQMFGEKSRNGYTYRRD